MLLKSDLDKRICDVEQGATNTQTYREFIRQSEEKFDKVHTILDEFDNEKLTEYLKFLNHQWTILFEF